MPVIARMSKRLYDVLGEDVATELLEWLHAMDLSYRTELRELNELNFARSDAKLEQRVAELRHEMAEFRAGLRQEMAEFKAELRQEMAEFKTELRQEMAEFKMELREDIAEFKRAVQEQLTAFRAELSALREENVRLRSDFGEEMAKQRASLIRWMFGFWVGTVIPLAGLVLALRGL